MFKQISPKDSFPEIEKQILEFWEKNKIFEKSVKNRPASKPFIFYEGPPTANGKPGMHHVVSRANKDVINRYRTMKGYRVERRAGWDTHGLPVEVQVEKELGFSGKKDIENFGIAKFNEKCKQSVWEYKELWEKMTGRMGYWVDMSDPYVTYENNYIESVWNLIKNFYDKGLVYSANKVVPHCPRCQTTLSSHEVAQGYKEVAETSIYVKLKRKWQMANGKSQNNEEYFLVWTTTPWTLPANVALAINPDITYVKVKVGRDILILAKDRIPVLEGSFEILEEVKGQELVGMEYEPIYLDVISSEAASAKASASQRENAFKVYAADFVTTEEGTGIVHIAPAFGADDMKVGIEANLPMLQPVNAEGHFTPDFKLASGKFVKGADSIIVEDLEKRGILYKTEKFTHDYPFCWRCDSPIIYYAKDSWFVKMSTFRDELVAKNEEINWVPEHLKEGRFGDWLKNIDDWAISRERYWGTPIPIWKCKCGAEYCVGSIKELGEISGAPVENLDLHRPFVDEITFGCTKCSERASRVPYIMDVWFDSGAMPYAQWHYPFENKKKFEENFPANFIAEGVDQTRGWFYTLHAISTVLFDSVAYKNVISNGLVLDKEGKKMSKSRGNIIDPYELMEKYGADALRWFFYSINSAGEDKRFDEAKIAEVVRKVFMILWNVYGFFATYANVGKWSPSHDHIKVEFRPILDRWIVVRLHQTINSVDKNLGLFDFTRSARDIEDFINDLSTWYLRRSRKRFQSENKGDKEAAFQTSHEVLIETVKMIAPFAPFLAEELYQRLTEGWKEKGVAESVHLTDFTQVDSEVVDHKVLDQIKLVRQIVEMGHNLRSQAKVKVRQPMAAVYVHGKFESDELFVEELEDLIKDELNVKELIVKSDGKAEVPKGFLLMELGGYTVALNPEITEELKKEGELREIIRQIQDTRKKAGLTPEQKVTIEFGAESKEISQLIEKNREKIIKATNLSAIEIVQGSGINIKKS